MMRGGKNVVEWLFSNPTQLKETRYKYWHAYGLKGQTQNGYIVSYECTVKKKDDIYVYTVNVDHFSQVVYANNNDIEIMVNKFGQSTFESLDFS